MKILLITTTLNDNRISEKRIKNLKESTSFFEHKILYKNIDKNIPKYKISQNNTIERLQTLINSDYESFYESKAQLHDSLNTISETTQKKLKQVLFKILEQSEFIDNIKNKNIQKPYLSEDLIKLIVQDDPKYLSAFLYSDNEINDYIKRFK